MTSALVLENAKLRVRKSVLDRIRGSAERRSQPSVILLDMAVAGLAIARSLGRRGIYVLALDTKENHWSHASKFVHMLRSADLRNEAYLLSVLRQIASAHRSKPVVIPLHDDHVDFLSRNRNELSKDFQFVIPTRETLNVLLDKRALHMLCESAGIPAPRAIFPSSYEDLLGQAADLNYPCIIKPAESRSWQTDKAQQYLKGRKVVEVHCQRELLDEYMVLRNNIDPRLLVEEVVPGPDAAMHYVVSYVGRSHKKFGYFTGRKHRMYPAHFGRGCYVEGVREDEAVMMADRLLDELNYTGNVGLEFKRDSRDGVFKLIEINARFGLWDGFADACGMNLIYVAYCDMTGQPVEPVGQYQPGKYWLNFDHDFWAAIQYYKQGELKIWDWARTLLRPHLSAISASDDHRPAIKFWLGFFKMLLGRLRVRVIRYRNAPARR